MSCQFQRTIFTKDTNGVFQSTNNCEEPITKDGLPQLTDKGLVNTEENQRRTLYYRDTLRYRESLGQQGHTTRYNECGDSLGRKSQDPSKCKVTPAAAIAKEDPFFDKVTVAGKKIEYSQYGKDDAAFTRIHFKEGNQETGYLRVQNPPGVYDRRGGRLYDHYLDGREKVGYHRRLASGVHDERACALGIEQFCQTTTPKQDTFQDDFHVPLKKNKSGDEMTSGALGVARLRGKATQTKDKEDQEKKTEKYNRARGYKNA